LSLQEVDDAVPLELSFRYLLHPEIYRREGNAQTVRFGFHAVWKKKIDENESDFTFAGLLHPVLVQQEMIVPIRFFQRIVALLSKIYVFLKVSPRPSQNYPFFQHLVAIEDEATH
jgi:hypothetical protein